MLAAKACCLFHRKLFKPATRNFSKAATHNQQIFCFLIVRSRPQGDIGARFLNGNILAENGQWILGNPTRVLGQLMSLT